MIKDQNIFITGGAGFIGSTLVNALVANNKITVFDSMARNALKRLPCATHSNLSIVQGDVMDKNAVMQAIKGANYVVHCAGVAGIDTVIKKPTHTMNVNIIGSSNVLEAALTLADCKRVVCFSTSEVFGSQAMDVRESDRTVIGAAGHARWTYAVSKLAEEHLAIAYHQEFGLPTTVLRPFNIYGPGQVGEGALKIFIQRALQDQPLYVYGNGTQIRAWCYVDDMVKATLCAMFAASAIGESFNIGNARSVETIFGLANTVVRTLNSKSSVEFRPALSADIELRIPCVEKMREILGLEATVDLHEGILRTADFYRALMAHDEPMHATGQLCAQK